MAVPVFPQSIPAPSETCLHVRTGFDLLVHAPYAATAPLFGPNGERARAGKHWDPAFIYPQPANDVGSDVESSVFTVRQGPLTAVWVNTIFDIDSRHVQYVYFLPDLMVTVIDVRFKPVTADTTEVNVVYTRTALTVAANEHVRAMSESDANSGRDWQQAIADYLGRSKFDGRP
jgi:hypothetical protein